MELLIPWMLLLYHAQELHHHVIISTSASCIGITSLYGEVNIYHVAAVIYFSTYHTQELHYWITCCCCCYLVHLLTALQGYYWLLSLPHCWMSHQSGDIATGILASSPTSRIFGSFLTSTPVSMLMSLSFRTDILQLFVCYLHNFL